MWDLAHVWLMCTVHALTCSISSHGGGDIHVCGLTHMWRGHALTCGTYSHGGGEPLTYSSRVAHVHGNALMCSISSMVERSPSRTAHVWLMCTVMPSRVAFPQWWKGAPHVQLTCGSHAQ